MSEFSNFQIEAEQARCLQYGSSANRPEAFNRGTRAVKNGKPNPYNGDALRLSWVAGYKYAESRARVKMNPVIENSLQSALRSCV